eukprot:4222943-Pyramimonas_sp.AAC.1
MAAPGGSHQRRRVGPAGHVRLRPRLQQQAYHLLVAGPRSEHQRGVAADSFRRAHLCARLQQQAQHLLVAVPRGEHQRGVAVAIGRPSIRPCRQQQ